MTPLHQRMLEDMQLRGFSARTQGCYVAAVRQLAEHYHRSPDLLKEEDLRWLGGRRSAKRARQPPTVVDAISPTGACPPLRRLQQVPHGEFLQLPPVYGIGSRDLSLGRTCWSEAFNKIVVAA